MKLGVCAQVFYPGASPVSFEQAVALAAELGFAAIELPVDARSPFLDLDELLAGGHERLARTVRDAGLEISALSNHQEGQLLLGPHGEDTDPIARGSASDKARHGHERLVKTAELARRLGVGVVNGFTGCEDYSRWFPWPLEDGYERMGPQVREVLLPLLDAFAARGVRFAHECHPRQFAYNLETAQALLQLVDGHPALGFNLDPANLLLAGMDPVVFVAELGDRVLHVHAKDGERVAHHAARSGLLAHGAWGRPGRGFRFRVPGWGDVPWRRLITELHLAGYRGVLAVEHEDPTMSPREGLVQAVRFLAPLLLHESGAGGPLVVTRLDVIAALAAHQQNLEPPPVDARAALVALPLAPLCRLLDAAWFTAWRGRELITLAEQLGGGDGPLPIVDLDGAHLAPRLAALWDSGVRTLVVHGDRDQPGYARALRYRWPGGLRLADAPGALDLLLDSREAVRSLGPGVVLAALDDQGDPRALREQGARPYAIDPQRRLGAWAGVLPPPGAAGTPTGARVREIWDAHWTSLGHPDVVRLAALGLDPALEAALRPPSAPDRDQPRARIFAVTGIDGAGKSSHADRLARTLRDAGAHVRVLKLYRQGAFLELANELGARTRRGAPLAAFRTSRIVKLVDSLRVYRDHLAPALAACDAVVMDRYTETHVAAAQSQLGWDLTGHPALAPFPRADLRVWLEVDPEVALRRFDQRTERRSADEHAVGLRGYAREFARLARHPGEVILDAAAPAEDNARAIAARALPLLGAPHGPAERSSLTPPGAAPGAAAMIRCRVQIGPGDALELGADVLALRAALETWSGADGIPESFWLEAYAAQLVLDVRTAAPADAWLALWPGALARMASHADLEMLRELERLLLATVEVTSYVDDPAVYQPAFLALGAQPSAAGRLAREYVDALDALAREAGWSRR